MGDHPRPKALIGLLGAGGRTTDSDRIPLFEIAWDEQDVLNAVGSIDRGGYRAKGPSVEELEAR